MVEACPALTASEGLSQGLLGSVDCDVQAMSQAGYQALAHSGSPAAVLLTGLLTLYIAVIGYRLLLGRTPLQVGELTVSAFKVGAVLALATNWPTYQTLVFDVLFQAPAELGRAVLGAMGSAGPGFPSDPINGLQAAFDEMQASAAFFARISLPSTSPLLGGVPFAAMALNSAAYLMMLSTLGLMLAAKIVLGLLLALGPVFVACLLFDQTRGLFEGWLRAALGFAIAPIVAQLALVVQLVMLQPLLVRLAAMRIAGDPDQAAATAAFMITLVTVGVSLGGLVGVFILTTGLRLPWTRPVASRNAAASVEPSAPALVGMTSPGGGSALPQRAEPRAAAVAAAAAAMERRDAVAMPMSASLQRRIKLSAVAGSAGAAPPGGLAPIGQSYRRAAQPRRAASNQRRDR